MTDVSAGLSLTGERTLPGIWHENYWFRRHEVAYRWLCQQLGRQLGQQLGQQLAGGVVVDAGCGEGYGAALLAADSAATVVGLDYDDATTRHVRARYPDVPVVRTNLVAMSLRPGAVDAVVSLQTIEHLWDQPGFVAECVRVLRPGGLLALTTPNRLTFSPGVPRGAKPLNPFHVNEFDADELRLLVGGHCTVVGLYGIEHGPRIHQWEQERGSIVAAQLATPPGEWDDDLARLVTSLSVADFSIGTGDVDGSLDLLLLARAR